MFIKQLKKHKLTLISLLFFSQITISAELKPWVNKEGKRPWIDLPYQDWPIFKQDNPKVVKKEVAYWDTGVGANKITYLDWLDENRILITNDNGSEAKEKGGRESTDMYNLITKTLNRLTDNKTLVYIDRVSGLIDTVVANPFYKDDDYFIYKINNNNLELYKKIDDKKKRYLYVDSNKACNDAFGAPDGYLYKYINNTGCKSYFITSRIASIKVDENFNTFTTYDSSLSLVSEDGVEKPILNDGLPLLYGKLSDFDYIPFLDSYYAAFSRTSKTEKLDGKTLFLIISKKGDVDLIEYPEKLMQKIKANIQWIDGAEPIPAGLIINTDKGGYLITPYEVKILNGPAEVGFYNPKGAYSGNGCLLVYPSMRVYLFFRAKATLKINDLCQGE